MSAQGTAHLEGYQEGELVGIEKGKQMGLEEGKRATARRLLAKGMEAELVAELVGLSIDEVQSLV